MNVIRKHKIQPIRSNVWVCVCVWIYRAGEGGALSGAIHLMNISVFVFNMILDFAYVSSLLLRWAIKSFNDVCMTNIFCFESNKFFSFLKLSLQSVDVRRRRRVGEWEWICHENRLTIPSIINWNTLCVRYSSKSCRIIQFGCFYDARALRS